MSFAKEVASKLAANVAAQAILIALGGGGAVVTTVLAFLSDGSPLSLILLGVSSAGLSLGIFGAYRRANPLPPDKQLRANRREMIERWKSFVHDWERWGGYIDDEEEIHAVDTVEYAEIQAAMEDAGMDLQHPSPPQVRQFIARQQRDWDLV